MKKILLIDESSLFRDYLAKKLEEKKFEVIQGKNGLDGLIKMRNDLPDLIIMDYFLSRKSSVEILEEKKKNPNTIKIPVIMVSSRIDSEKIREIASFNIKKFFSKPIKLDALLKTVSEILNVVLEIDTTPCIIEAHFNDEILFIEIARGLNLEKIELLKYKITELLSLYQILVPKVLIMLSNIEFSRDDTGKLRFLLNTIIDNAQTKPKYVKILTNSEFVKSFVSGEKGLTDIGVTGNLGDAMDDLIGIKPDIIAHDEVVRDKFLKTSAPKKDGEETIQLRFEAEKEELSKTGFEKLGKEITLGIVDDDIVIQELVQTVFSDTGWKIKVYGNGKVFVDDLPGNDFDIVFLDLMMPEMNGFQVLQYLKERNINLQIIVFSALSRKETVVKAVSFGIHSYLIKPLKPEKLLQKAAEVLNMNF
ncbi:MAG: response regulator [Spirochaetota bacterium]